MSSPENAQTPRWGDTPEFREWCEAQHAQDPRHTTLPDLIRPELEAAQKESPQEYSNYLNSLSGIGTFAVKGTVYIPKTTKAFGDWILKPNNFNPEIIGSEEVETQSAFPYVKDKVAYTLRSARIQPDRGVMVVAEEFVEDGRPRVMHPDELELFDLYHISETDILEERDRRNTEGALRYLGLDAKSKD